MRNLRQLLIDRKNFKSFTLFFDIETFQYNEAKGQERPSQYKNMTFSLAVSWIQDGLVEMEVFPNFKEFFDTIIEEYKDLKKKPKIFLNAHNTNKYDNHFLRKDLLYYYPSIEVRNYFLNTATTEKSNQNSYRLKDLTKKDKEGVILEKRVKSSINLEMIIFLKGIQFETVDNWVKTNSSISMLGKKLLRLGKVTEDELKTDFNYLKYNLDDDLTENEARQYAQEIFDSLDDDQMTYIKNDVILLAKSAYYYSDLFNGFDYSKMTFTSNILDSYNTNDLTSFQLLNRIGSGKEKREIRFTDYQFANKNFYDYLKPFYRGGLNFYNQFFIGQNITSGVFGMDINSSYPYAMHNFKIPTYLKDYGVNETPEEKEIVLSDDEFTLYQISKEAFDFIILEEIESIILRQMLVKYYATDEFININSYTFRMIENITGVQFDSIPVYSYVTFTTEYFGSREQIAEFYRIKTQGKYKKKLHYKNPYQMYLTDEITDEKLSDEEVAHSKVNLNGLYGIPALRPFFNLFRLDNEGNYINIENGHQNAERNIVFSIFVTSVSLWNLLSPFKYLTQSEIDDNFLYCDTDSLYMKETIKDKIPKEIYSDFTLGAWDLEHEGMKNFYVLNHKKYAYTDENDKIQVRAGGVPTEAFDKEMSFEQFIDSQFSDGVEIQNLKSIYNDGETISLYPSTTKLELGTGYRIHSSGKIYDNVKEKMFQEIKKDKDSFSSDVLYIESVIGTFSLSELFPYSHEVKNKKPLQFLEIRQEQIKNLINQN